MTPPNDGFDAVLCTLGLTVIPDWRAAWAASYGWLERGPMLSRATRPATGGA